MAKIAILKCFDGPGGDNEAYVYFGVRSFRGIYWFSDRFSMIGVYLSTAHFGIN